MDAAPSAPVAPAGARAIHLLYVPTMACNLHCSYCYLGAQTTTAGYRADAGRAVSTLRYALTALADAGVLAFNVSLHGGEVTVLPPSVLDGLFALIRQHYLRNLDAISALGHRKSAPHVKTNLYRFADLYPLFDRHKVSVSASVDLPLALHDRHRRTRGDRGWRPRLEANLRLLAGYPHGRKVSATLSAEHLADLPALVDDIWYVHRTLGLDMTTFNLMLAFPSALNTADQGPRALPPASPRQQVELYRALHRAFRGTELEEGLRRHWFEEFTPSYCTNAVNCGERFFLLQSDGSVYSCVRGQGIPEFRYGNIFHDPIDTILTNGARQIAAMHQKHGFDPQCRGCDALSLCNTGCPVVKFQRGSARSYTCDLQKEIYRDSPLCYPAAREPHRWEYAAEYAARVHPGAPTGGADAPADGAGTPTDGAEAPVAGAPVHPPAPATAAVLVPSELGSPGSGLRALIEADPVLTELYRPDAWILEVGDDRIPLHSQILRSRVDIHTVVSGDPIRLHLRRDLLAVACPEPVRNTVYLQMLRDTPVVYGDDRRAKQEHLFTYQVYANCLRDSDLGPQWAMVELADLIDLHRHLYLRGVRNNLLVTTGHLRDYHYQKQRENAFYHIQAVNLPFPNVEFHYLTGEPS